MPSDESNSSSAPAPETPAKKPVNPVGLVVLSLLLMAGLVWVMAPTRARFQPAPLRPPPAGCPRTAADFVPSDVTDMPNEGFRALTPAQRNHVLFRLNMEPCPCGCNTSIAVCRLSHPSCPVCNDLADKIIAEEKNGTTAAPATGSRK